MTRDDLVASLQPGQLLEITIWKDESDEEGTTFQCAIDNVNNHNLLLIPPDAMYEQFYNSLNLPLVVGALYGDGLVPCMFYPIFQSVDKIAKKGFWIKLPFDMEVQSIQRRAFVRINARLPVVLESDVDLPAHTIDISGGGLQFASAKSFMPGTELTLHIQFQQNNPSVCIKAKVVQSRENVRTRKAEEAIATSCQFVDLSESTQQRLVAECFRIELYQKKHLHK